MEVQSKTSLKAQSRWDTA